MRIPDRTPDRLRRIQSLTGTLPLGAFLVEHLAVNSFALAGPESFRRVAHALGGLPFVAALEVLLIALPLAVHSVIGILIATELPNAAAAPASRREVVQRVTGVLLLPYLIYHVWSTRLSPEVMAGRADLFEVMHAQVADPGGLVFHAAGVVLAAWHLGNGLPNFARRWGLARTEGAAAAVARAGSALSIALAVLGVASLVAFSSADPGAAAPARAGAAP